MPLFVVLTRGIYGVIGIAEKESEHGADYAQC